MRALLFTVLSIVLTVSVSAFAHEEDTAKSCINESGMPSEDGIFEIAKKEAIGYAKKSADKYGVSYRVWIGGQSGLWEEKVSHEPQEDKGWAIYFNYEIGLNEKNSNLYTRTFAGRMLIDRLTCVVIDIGADHVIEVTEVDTQ